MKTKTSVSSKLLEDMQYLYSALDLYMNDIPNIGFIPNKVQFD
jgi:hypothetical protein